jgi:cytochrome b6-f complex iron-sulfur subunit
MEESIPSPKPVSRREFLYYIWAASAGLLTVEAGVGLAWFLSASRDIPVKETLLHLSPAEIPEIGSSPIRHEKKVWFSNTPQGFFAFRDLCPHLGCYVRWVKTNNRFECPCHGAKFHADGTYIEGPAYRNLDSYKVVVTTPDGERVSPTEDGGGPVNITGAIEITVDLEVQLFGKARGVGERFGDFKKRVY